MLAGRKQAIDLAWLDQYRPCPAVPLQGTGRRRAAPWAQRRPQRLPHWQGSRPLHFSMEPAQVGARTPRPPQQRALMLPGWDGIRVVNDEGACWQLCRALGAGCLCAHTACRRTPHLPSRFGAPCIEGCRRSPHLWKDPDEFRPERFTGAPGCPQPLLLTAICLLALVRSS